MARSNRKKKNNKKILIIIIIILVLLLISLLVIFKKIDFSGNKPRTEAEIKKQEQEYLEEKNKNDIDELSKMSEQKRMQYYCGKFFGLIGNKLYEEAYDLLYSEYKENYFPNLANFERYIEEYFPEEIGLAYQNVERLGDIYVLTVSVADGVNGSYGKNFTLYVVIKENSLNDFEISFSRNSAVDIVEEEE